MTFGHEIADLPAGWRAYICRGAATGQMVLKLFRDGRKTPIAAGRLETGVAPRQTAMRWIREEEVR